MDNPFTILEERLKRIEGHLLDLVHSNSTPSPAHVPEEYLDVDATAKFLKTAKQTVYQNKSKGILNGYKRFGKLYFKRSELIAFLEQGATATRKGGRS